MNVCVVPVKVLRVVIPDPDAEHVHTPPALSKTSPLTHNPAAKSVVASTKPAESSLASIAVPKGLSIPVMVLVAVASKSLDPAAALVSK